MKRIALLLVLASTACASMTKGGARGPQIQRTDEAEPSQPQAGSLDDARPEVGQR